MNKVSILLLVGVFFATIVAECPNACSGHGTCNIYDDCTCCNNWQGEDCSLRTCPFGNAHADIPKGDLNIDDSISGPTDSVIFSSTVYPFGTTEQYPDSQDNEGHFYYECSGKGSCDRSTGLCSCFPGYEGTSCQRISCPNACSGKGTCQSIKYLAENKEMGDGVTNSDLAGLGPFDYYLWDRVVTQGCQCDAEFFGADCSLQHCRHGVDPLFYGTTTYELVTVTFEFEKSYDSGTFDLVIFDYFGEKYHIGGLAYSDPSTTTTYSSCYDIKKHFPNHRLQDTTYGGSTTRFCEVYPNATVHNTGYTSLEYRFNFNYGNPGFHKNMYVENLNPDNSNSTNGVYAYIHVLSEGLNTVIETSDAFDLILPGYVLNVTDSYHIWSSEVLSQFISTSNSTTTTTRIKVDTYDLTVVDIIDVAVDMGSHVYKYMSKITVNMAVSIDYTTQPIAIYAALTTGDEYVSECAGRGTCDYSTGLCSCYTGYRRHNCDTQSPVC